MSNIKDVVNEINQLVSEVVGRKTKAFRQIAALYKKSMKSWEINQIYELCDQLLQYKKRGHTIIAYQILFDNKRKYNVETYEVFEQFMHNYITDWWDCDDFMTHAFMELFKQYPFQIKYIYSWINSDNFAVRRCAPVVLIRLSQAKLIQFELIEDICLKLMSDDHYLVQKGYGWLLKESVKNYKDEVIEFLKYNVKSVPRVAFRYAVEKLPKDDKLFLMGLEA